MRELAGLKAANAEGALNLEVADGARAPRGEHHVAAAGRARAPDARGDPVLLDETVTLAPDAPFVRDLAVAAGTREESLRAGGDGRRRRRAPLATSRSRGRRRPSRRATRRRRRRRR